MAPVSAQEPVIRAATEADAGWIVERHAELYARDDGFDDTFAPVVAGVLARFFADHDPLRERGWIVGEGRGLGSIFCMRLDDSTAQLRLFLLEPEVRGVGLGRHLLATCTGFAKAVGFRRMTLRTHQSRRAACRLYAANGFACVASRPVRSFGRDLVEQTWTRVL